MSTGFCVAAIPALGMIADDGRVKNGVALKAGGDASTLDPRCGDRSLLMTAHSVFHGLGHHDPSGGCELTTTSGVYLTDLSVEMVRIKIRDFDLIPVRDGNGTALFLNPMAITTLREKTKD